MIFTKTARDLCDDIENIENYQKAINDNENYYLCHHKFEIKNIWGIEVHITTNELKGLGLYYHRPSDEFIFLDRKTHRKLHNKSKEFRKKMSLAKTGKKTKRVYTKWSEEMKKQMSESHKRGMTEERRNLLRKAYYKRQKDLIRVLNKPVLQLDPITHKVINRFESIVIASTIVGNNPNSSNITSCCKGRRKKAFGYEWRYCE